MKSSHRCACELKRHQLCRPKVSNTEAPKCVMESCGSFRSGQCIEKQQYLHVHPYGPYRIHMSLFLTLRVLVVSRACLVLADFVAVLPPRVSIWSAGSSSHSNSILYFCFHSNSSRQAYFWPSSSLQQFRH